MLLDQIFISYTHSNGAPVSETVAALRALGVRVWEDNTGIADGDNIVRRLEAGLGSSRNVVLFASKDYFERAWTRAEYEATIYATVNDSSRRVFVVQLSPDATFPPFVAGLRRIPFTSGAEVAQRLYSAMNGAGSGAPDSPAVPALSLRALDWESVSEVSVIACANAIWQRRHELAGSGRDSVTVIVDVERGAAISLAIVRSLVANEMLMTKLNGEIGLYNSAARMAARYRAALTGDMGRDVPTLNSAETLTNQAQESLGSLRNLCRDLSRSVSLVTASA